MITYDEYSSLDQDGKRLWQAAAVAVVLEALFFLGLGLGHLPFLRNPFNSTDYVEAQIVQLPPNAHLTGAQAVKDEDEIFFSRKQSHKAKKEEKKEPPKVAEPQNQVEAGSSLGPTHGPVALYAPSPVIPPYLRDQNIKAFVVIEFLITARGQITPRLLQSSGNDELDAVALHTVTQWKFTPASRDNIPIDSKTRLRILFEVS
jgi:TonB family protein